MKKTLVGAIGAIAVATWGLPARGAGQHLQAGLESGSGAVETAEATNERSSWFTEAKLTPSQGGAFDIFGHAVSLSGSRALVGAPQDDSAYVFAWNGRSWTEEKRLRAPPDGDIDSFGHSVVLVGDVALVGAPFDDDKGTDAGAVYVFVRSAEIWTLQAKLTASDGAALDAFGGSVSLSGDTAVVGRSEHALGMPPDSAYVFVRNAGVWTEEAVLNASDGQAGDSLGISVSLSGDTALVGADSAHAAYVFVRNAGAWTEEAKLTAVGGAAFGRSVSL